MEHSIFYTFYQNAGFKVYTSRSSEWCEIQHGMLISIPYHRLIDPDKDELDGLLKESGAWGLRFPTNLENFGFASNLQVCRQVGYDYQFLNSNVRRKVRKGEKCCEVRPVGLQELKTDGYRLCLLTLQRQKRDDPKADVEYWNRICDGLFKTDGVNILGVYCEDRLAAFAIILETETMAELIIQNSDSELLHCYPNNLLSYYFTWHYLTENKNPLPVCYGLGSLEETPRLDHFKTEMGYVLEPIKQRLYFRKELRFFLRPSFYYIANFVNKNLVKGRSYKFDKICAIFKRYLEQY